MGYKFRGRIAGAHTPAEAEELARQWLLESALAQQAAVPRYERTVPGTLLGTRYTGLAEDARVQAMDEQGREIRRQLDAEIQDPEDVGRTDERSPL